jgi:hypothetical protein
MTALSAVMGFYLLARSIAALQLIGQSGVASDSLSQKVVGGVINAIALILPRLDQFTRTEWLAYSVGSWATLAPLLVQTALYTALLTSAGLFDLYRKNL